ncbi:DUF4365 domain-containing protein [Lentzea sp. DG1S-22]|uniref:DUF4365 domain-containing protein n=1 Tax=Lentzea sp. DG1S-22 TaxID=3108822 RepID=UPI002E7708A5|nr:DUF4365 domain-containing protein [Lentzea sp. DG1S-22]WVH79814.1 DUF4365 domain-containing protein [Lentzea sp. DG1S-22]
MTEQKKARQVNIRPVIESSFTECMEQLQEGYVFAVAATAGCTVEVTKRDIYGTDIRIIRPAAEVNGEEITVLAQLKNTTTVRPDPQKDFFSYQLKKREYFDKLAMPRRGPKAILIVMATTPVQADWTKGSHESLELQYCCYWRSLEGETAADGVKSPTVRIPTANVFDASALTEILDRLDREEELV